MVRGRERKGEEGERERERIEHSHLLLERSRNTSSNPLFDFADV
jgi:hypothetical protein